MKNEIYFLFDNAQCAKYWGRTMRNLFEEKNIVVAYDDNQGKMQTKYIVASNFFGRLLIKLKILKPQVKVVTIYFKSKRSDLTGVKESYRFEEGKTSEDLILKKVREILENGEKAKRK